MPHDGEKVTCAWVEERFSSALEAGLPAGEQAALDRHLESCAACRAGFQGFVEAAEALGAYEPRPVPATFLPSVLEATASAPPGPVVGARVRARSWSLILAWSTAAAAALIALVVWFTRPSGPPPEAALEPRPAAVLSLPVQGEGLVRVHGGRAIPVADGAVVTLVPGDQVRIQAPAPARWVVDVRPLAEGLDRWLQDLRRDLREFRRLRRAARTPRAPVILRVDTGPLARALERGAGQMAEAARLLARAAPATREPGPIAAGPARPPAAPSPSAPARGASVEQTGPSSRSPAPAVALVYEAGGAVVLETAGPPGRVIPELLGLLDEDDPKLSAAATAQLEFIQARLRRDHAVQPPVDPVPPKPEGSTGIAAGWKRLFGKARPRSPEPTESERWRRWWDVNRRSILCLADEAGP